MAREEEWIDTDELARREGVSVQTILRAVRKDLLTHRRKGLGKVRAPLEFPATIAHEQLVRLRERAGIHVASSPQAAAPTLLELAHEIRTLNSRFERLSAEIRTALSQQAS